MKQGLTDALISVLIIVGICAVGYYLQPGCDEHCQHNNKGSYPPTYGYGTTGGQPGR